jgi:hypothetical protein
MDINNEAFSKLIEEADSVLVITETGNDVHLHYSSNLDEMEVLDLLALTTSEFYNVADEGKTKLGN